MSTDTVRDDHLVTIRRNVWLHAVVGVLAFVLGFAYVARGGFLAVLFGLVLLALAALNLPALMSPSTPLLALDDQGIRFRVGLAWRGLPWREVRQVVLEEPTSLLRDGRLVVVARDPGDVLDDLDLLGRLHLRWNVLWYGAPISLPLGHTTVVDVPDLAAELEALGAGRTEIVVVEPEDQHEDQHEEVEDTEPVFERIDRWEPVDEVPEDPFDVPFDDPMDERFDEPAPVLPLREVSSPARFDVRLEETEEAEELTEHLVLPEWDHDSPVRLVPEVEETVAPRTALIGTKIVHAREMLDMSIDELSQRTRIRPHVLEAIEVDDFGPCGGDFYARGHLTAISRVLGLTLDPLLKTYDEHYAQAPINARRVFEAELSTGLSGGMRATLGGPRWSLVIGAVLGLTMVWGLVRIFAGGPDHLNAAPDPSSQVAGLSANHTPITSTKMKTKAVSVRAAYAGTHVVVKDRTGKVLWSGDLALGKTRKIVGLAPFTVSADNAGAVLVSIKGHDLGDLGTAGEAGSKSFG